MINIDIQRHPSLHNTLMPSFAQKMGIYSSLHKMEILAVTIISVATLTYVYLNTRDAITVKQPECAKGFFDDLTCLQCVDGKFDISGVSTCMPDYTKYKNLIDSCLNGTITDGCGNHSFYRELSLVCKENPKAALCNGNYSHSEWVKQIHANSNTFANN